MNKVFLLSYLNCLENALGRFPYLDASSERLRLNCLGSDFEEDFLGLWLGSRLESELLFDSDDEDGFLDFFLFRFLSPELSSELLLRFLRFFCSVFPSSSSSELSLSSLFFVILDLWRFEVSVSDFDSSPSVVSASPLSLSFCSSASSCSELELFYKKILTKVNNMENITMFKMYFRK